MSRPLTGSKKRVASGWQAGLPVRTGSRQKKTYTFVTEGAADRWIGAGKESLNAGEYLPVPPASDLVNPAAARRVTRFGRVGHAWVDEYYGELHRGGVSRERDARRHVKYIDTFMAARNLGFETMTREGVKALQASLTRATPMPTVSAVSEGVDVEQRLTLQEALATLVKLPSRSTLKRRISAGTLEPVERPAAGGYLYRVGDLYGEEAVQPDGTLRRGPKTDGVRSQDAAADVMWVFQQVCLFATDRGIEQPGDRGSLRMHRSDKPAPDEVHPVDLVQCAEVAGRLHAVHQVALWLMRILGLRISEAYGIRVGDVLDQGPGEFGLVSIKGQGGRKFLVRGPDGQAVAVDHTGDTKTPNSRRILVVPPTLMALLRVVVSVFHTDPDGHVRREARLVPGLRRPNVGGQSALRTALSEASAVLELEDDSDEFLELVFSWAPHSMRKSVITELELSGTAIGGIQRLAGHTLGTTVTHRHYLLNDPRLRLLKEVAQDIEQMVLEQLPGGLMVPTAQRCTTKNQQNLARDRVRIDAELVERRWLVTELDGDALLSSAEIAAHLDVVPKTARLWMEDGTLPSVVWRERAQGAERRSRLSDVMELERSRRSRVTLRDLATELGQQYHSVYQFVRAQDLRLQQQGARQYVLPPETERVIRSHYEQQSALRTRAVPFSTAVEQLGLPAVVVERLITDSILTLDEPAHDGRRMVTRESLQRAIECRPSKQPSLCSDDLVSWDDAKALTALSDSQLRELVEAGSLRQVAFRRRRHVTRSSLIRHLARIAPERLTISTSQPSRL